MKKMNRIICALLFVVSLSLLFLAIVNYPLRIYVVNASNDKRNVKLEIMKRVKLEWNLSQGVGCRTRLWSYPEGGGVITDDRGNLCDDFYVSCPLVDCDIVILVMDNGIQTMCIK